MHEHNLGVSQDPTTVLLHKIEKHINDCGFFGTEHSSYIRAF